MRPLGAKLSLGHQFSVLAQSKVISLSLYPFSLYPYPFIPFPLYLSFYPKSLYPHPFYLYLFIPICLSLSLNSFPFIPIPLSLTPLSQSLCKYCGHLNRLFHLNSYQIKYSTNIVKKLYKYCANIVQIMCKYLHNIVQILKEPFRAKYAQTKSSESSKSKKSLVLLSLSVFL